MKRGEIWWASLGEPTGSTPGFRRPVLVLQSNAFNASGIATVIVAAITSYLDLAGAPGNVRLKRTDSGLTRVSVVNVSQILTVDRGILSTRVRTLPATAMAAVDQGIRLVLSLA